MDYEFEGSIVAGAADAWERDVGVGVAEFGVDEAEFGVLFLAVRWWWT